MYCLQIYRGINQTLIQLCVIASSPMGVKLAVFLSLLTIHMEINTCKCTHNQNENLCNSVAPLVFRVCLTSCSDAGDTYTLQTIF